ncbi:MAG: trypsin-like peptidase domain-containing protein [Dehalococcoidales bacterium]|nr:trypsin-like peptidase domain-containing protein [Dehalococcoidales bacterium]
MFNFKYRFISLILVLSLTLSTGCDLLTKTEPESNNSTTNETNPIDEDWTSATVSSNAIVLPSIAQVVAKIKPSVVAINTEVITYDFFNRPYSQGGAGSGWIIDESGIIITNNHVVEGAENITVTLADNRTFPVNKTAVFTDPLTDLAVLKIEAENLPAASIGDSSRLRVGDWLVAIGNSLGLGISAKEGIVSRIGVSVPISSTQTLYDLIETSAAINPGNSGGPLVNMAGEVIGITSAKIATTGVEGMGYAISSNTAIPIIEHLIQNGYVIRPYLGISYSDVNSILVTQYNLPVETGIIVADVIPGYPAETEAGLQTGDIIVALDDQEIINGNDLRLALINYEIGQTVEITFWRGDTKETAHATLTESPPPY